MTIYDVLKNVSPKLSQELQNKIEDFLLLETKKDFLLFAKRNEIKLKQTEDEEKLKEEIAMHLLDLAMNELYEKKVFGLV
ncbi:MAG: hypothetical protein GXO62_02245 [Epsilonproteobacteria bacterium]|nr:hypothetical protein [Campylobacterota bacterium]